MFLSALVVHEDIQGQVSHLGHVVESYLARIGHELLLKEPETPRDPPGNYS